jgi:2'-5' RNA ligase
MPFGIELLFDGPTEKRIRSIWKKLEKNKVSTPLYRDNPHVTLAAFEKSDMASVERRCRTIARGFRALPACFESIGSFTREGVFFLAPVATADLLGLHQKIHEALRGLAKNSSRYYWPGVHWAPHCTLSMDKSPKGYRKALDLLGKIPVGWKGWFTRLEAHEYEAAKGGVTRRLRTVFSISLKRK